MNFIDTIKERARANIKRIIPLRKFEFFSKIDAMHIMHDQQKQAYNNKYNFIVNPLE